MCVYTHMRFCRSIDRLKMAAISGEERELSGREENQTNKKAGEEGWEVFSSPVESRRLC